MSFTAVLGMSGVLNKVNKTGCIELRSLNGDLKRNLGMVACQNPLERAHNAKERLSGNGRNLFEI